MNLQSNDFELFGLTQQFAQERSVLDARWKALQGQAHPDKFAAQGAAAQRLAMQWSVRVNEAHQRLRDPIRRGAYMCELAGAPIDAERNTAMPTEFLMQQMAWREALDDADTEDAMEALLDEVLQARHSAIAQLGQLLDEQHNAPAASAVVRSLMFIDKFALDVQNSLDRL